jgi:asparagine synthase (glutamine-hydrolysing)
MCGLLQVIQRRPIDPMRLRAVLDTMSHRGPDAEGLSVMELASAEGAAPVHIGYGHRRLAILDLDPRSNQPFRRDDHVLVYNGEIYNFRDVRGRLESQGATFSTSGDTEVLLASASRSGREALHEMSGMWAFVLTDEKEQRLLAARDRYGKKPLFFWRDDATLIFSSTITAICRYLGIRPKFREDQLLSYLAHGVLFPGGDEATYLEGIGQVAPGGFAQFDMRTWTLTHGRWFDVHQYAREHAYNAKDLPEIIRDAVAKRLVSDRHVGLLLSGGVDSTVVLSALHAQGLQNQLKCFIGETGRSEDADYAWRCIKQLGMAATEVRLDYGSTSFERFLRMCRHMERPFPLLGNSMAMGGMYEAIAEHDVRVVLDGTGGDEIFGGYWDRQYPFALREAAFAGDFRWLARTTRENPKWVWEALKSFTPDLPFARSGLSKLLTHPSYAIEKFCSDAVMRAPSCDPLKDGSLSFAQALATDAERGRLGEWIWQNDRNAMMASIENRSPLLDYRLLGFIGSGYANKFRGKWNKHELRSAFGALTPLPTQWRRQKQGFRWNARKFYASNAANIIELVAQSKVAARHVDVNGFIDAARRNPRYLSSRLSSRLLCIAGLEQTLGLTSA